MVPGSFALGEEEVPHFSPGIELPVTRSSPLSPCFVELVSGISFGFERERVQRASLSESLAPSGS